MSDLKEQWQEIKCGKKNFFVDFDFHNYFNHKTNTGRFEFQQPLFSFLDNENKEFEENNKWKLCLSLNLYDKEPFFEFNETKRELFINYPKFKESCEKSRTSNNNDAKIFFGKDLNLRAALKTQSSDKKQEIILENLDEETVLKWWNGLTVESKNKFLDGINSKVDFSKIPSAELLLEITSRDLNIEDIKTLNSKFEITKLENSLKIWEENKDNSLESFWQKTFEDEKWILSQIFACPVVFIKGNPYCGGKSSDDKGGVYSDFRFSGEIIENSIFIEIKTPSTLIIGSKYRGDSEENQEDQNLTYSMSKELSGGITQVINQRQVAIMHFEEKMKIRNSKCILLMGMAKNLKPAEKKSFDLFRNSNKDVEIITFDELFLRIENLLNLLKKDK